MQMLVEYVEKWNLSGGERWKLQGRGDEMDQHFQMTYPVQYKRTKREREERKGREKEREREKKGEKEKS